MVRYPVVGAAGTAGSARLVSAGFGAVRGKAAGRLVTLIRGLGSVERRPVSGAVDDTVDSGRAGTGGVGGATGGATGWRAALSTVSGASGGSAGRPRCEMKRTPAATRAASTPAIPRRRRIRVEAVATRAGGLGSVGVTDGAAGACTAQTG